jgi:chemotaxis protein methyltransferase WspC
MTFASVRQFLVEHTALEPTLLEGAGFEMQVAERVASIGGDESRYVMALRDSQQELDRLIAGIAVPETWLFRYLRSYDVLADALRRRLATGATTLRLLSLGCATGQEPYCMAMTALHAGWPAPRIRIDAVDRNEEFLRTAVAGVYGPSSIRTEIPAWAMAFISHHGAQIEIDASVRVLVRFRRADLMDARSWRDESAYDVIFCRNVLIYLSATARTQLLDSIVATLTRDGMLFVGHAEHGLRLPTLRTVTAPHAFAFERGEAAARPSSPALASPVARTAAPHPAPRSSDNATTTTTTTTRREPTIDDARTLADAGRTAECEAVLRACLPAADRRRKIFELLGLVQLNQPDRARSKRCFEQALYLEPARVVALMQLALIHEREGDASRATLLWERAQRATAAPAQERHS